MNRQRGILQESFNYHLLRSSFGLQQIFMLQWINHNHHRISNMAKTSLHAIFEGENRRISEFPDHINFLFVCGRRNVYVGVINQEGIELNYTFQEN